MYEGSIPFVGDCGFTVDSEESSFDAPEEEERVALLFGFVERKLSYLSAPEAIMRGLNGRIVETQKGVHLKIVRICMPIDDLFPRIIEESVALNRPKLVVGLYMQDGGKKRIAMGNNLANAIKNFAESRPELRPGFVACNSIEPINRQSERVLDVLERLARA